MNKHEFFDKFQKPILELANNKYARRNFLDIPISYKDREIIKINGNSFDVDNRDGTFSSAIYTYDVYIEKFAKIL